MQREQRELCQEQVHLHVQVADILKYGVAEIKVIGVNCVRVGFFDNPELICDAVQPFNGAHSIYIGRCPRPFRYMDAEASNRLVAGHHGAKGSDIEYWTSFMLDIDPLSEERPSSDEDFRTAVDFAEGIRKSAPGCGVMGSGNGAYLVMPLRPVKVEERTEAQFGAYEERARAYLKELGLEGKLRIDPTQDLVRVYRLAGTINPKGEGSEGRKHRMCEILTPINQIHVIDGLAERITSIPVPEGKEEQKSQRRKSPPRNDRVNIQQVCDYYGFELKSVSGKLRGVCPIHPDAHNASSFIVDPNAGTEGMFYCHSSKHEHNPNGNYYKSGGPIHLIMTMEKIGWNEAVGFAREKILGVEEKG